MTSLTIVFIIFLLFTGFFFIATKILEGLKPKWFPYYGFDKYFPQLGNYTVIFYIAILLLLAIVMAVLGRSSFVNKPA